MIFVAAINVVIVKYNSLLMKLEYLEIQNKIGY